MRISRMFRRKNPHLFILALILGVMLATGGSVWATSVGTNVSVSGTLTVTGAATNNGNSTFGDASGDINLFTGILQASTTALFTGASTFYGNVTLGDTAADSLTINAATTTITSASATSWAIATSSANIAFLRFDTSNYRIGVGTTSPGATFAIGGAGDLYAIGALTIDGNATLGNAAGDTLTVNAATVSFANAGTSTIPAASATSWAIATSSANIPFLRFDTSNYRIGLGTTTPGATFSVVGDAYVLNGFGVGLATTTAGVIQNSGNTLLGDAAADLVMLNAASVIYNNAGTTTIPAANAASWAIATSSANIAFLRFDTSNYRIGVGTTTPGATFSVGGGGNIYALGGLGVGLATTTAGAIENSGNTLLGDAAADLVMLNAASVIHNNVGTTTIPAANAVSWAIATSSASIPFVRYDTSNYRVGIGTTTPGATFSVGGAGDIYGLGALTIDGNATLGNASGDTVTINAGTVTLGNAATTTIPASNASAWAIATSSANIPLVKYDTSNTRVGVGTTTPGATLAVGGDVYASGRLDVTGATIHVGTTRMGTTGTALTQVLTGYVDCGPIIGLQSIAASSTGTVACTGLSNVSANDAVFLTATTTAIVSGGSVSFTGKASTTATNIVQAELMNWTGAAWTIATSTWRYLIIR